MPARFPLPLAALVAACLALAAPAAAAQDGFQPEGESPLPEITQAGDVPPFFVEAETLDEEDAVRLQWNPVQNATRYEVYVANGPFPAEVEEEWTHLTDPERAGADDARLEVSDDVVSFLHLAPPLPEGGATAIEYVIVAYGGEGEIVAQGRSQAEPFGDDEPLDAPPIGDEGPFGDDAEPGADEQAEEEAAGTTGSFLLMVLILVAIAVIGGIAYALIQVGRR